MIISHCVCVWCKTVEKKNYANFIRRKQQIGHNIIIIISSQWYILLYIAKQSGDLFPLHTQASLTSVSRACTHVLSCRYSTIILTYTYYRYYTTVQSLIAPRKNQSLHLHRIISLSLSLSFSPLSNTHYQLSFYISVRRVPLVPARCRRRNNINTIARISLHITHTHTHGIWWCWTSTGTRLGSTNK